MKSIEEELKPLSGYLISIKRNTLKGWYELEVGVPADWIYKSNEHVNCEIQKKTDVGHILIISPKNENITIDDLVAFVKLIIQTNSKIREREMEFKKKMDQVKKDLENQAKDFYKELDDLKEKSFSKFNTNKSNDDNSKSSENKNDKTNTQDDKSEQVTTTTTTKKRGRGRPSKKAENEQKESNE